MDQKETAKQFVVCMMAAISALHLLTSCNAQNNENKIPGTQLFTQAPGSPISINCAPGNIALGDLNRDGNPDLVAACGQSRQIVILTGDGTGRFQTLAGSLIAVPDFPHEIAIADLNNDSTLDIVFASHDSYNITILSGDGQGGFTVSPNSPVVMKNGSHPHTHGLAIGDLNKDGKHDLVTGNNADNDVAVALGDGNGGFTKAKDSPFPVGQAPYPLAIGDVNNDLNPDIVASSTLQGGQPGRSLTLLLGDGLGGFQRSPVPVRTNNPGYVSIGDINGDQNPDLVATHLERNELTVLLGDGRGNFIESAASPFNLGHSAWQVEIKDINHDGKPDILAAAGKGVRVMLGDGHGFFSQSPGSPYSTGEGAWRFAIGDINADNKPDIATSNLDSKTVTVLLGK